MASEISLQRQELHYLTIAYCHIFEGLCGFLGTFFPIGNRKYDKSYHDYDHYIRHSYKMGLESLSKYKCAALERKRKLYYSDKLFNNIVGDEIFDIYMKIINNQDTFQRKFEYGKKDDLKIKDDMVTHIILYFLNWAPFIFQDLNLLLSQYSCMPKANKNLIKATAFYASAVKGLIYANSLKLITDLLSNDVMYLFYTKGNKEYSGKIPDYFFNVFYNPAKKWLEDKELYLKGSPQATETLYNSIVNDHSLEAFYNYFAKAIVTNDDIRMSQVYARQAEFHGRMRRKTTYKNDYYDYLSREFKELKNNIINETKDAETYYHKTSISELYDCMPDFDLSKQEITKEMNEVLSFEEDNKIKPTVFKDQKTNNTSTSSTTSNKKTTVVVKEKKSLFRKIKNHFYKSDFDKELSKERKAKKREYRASLKRDRKKFSFHFDLEGGNLLGSLGIGATMLVIAGLLLIFRKFGFSYCASFTNKMCGLITSGKTFFEPFFIVKFVGTLLGKLFQNFVFVLLAFVLWPFIIIAFVGGGAIDLLILILYYVAKFILLSIFVLILFILFYASPAVLIIGSIIFSVKYAQNSGELNVLDYAILIVSICGTIALGVMYYV